MDKRSDPPSPVDTARHRALSAASRVRMLDLLRRSPDGLTTDGVAAATGLHPSTVRAHLDRLAESGLATRERRADGSPGRPAWRYRAIPGAGAGDGDPARADGPYRELAAALIGRLARDEADPHEAAVRTGRDWGRALATAVAGAAGSAPVTPVDAVVRVLRRLGFTPRLQRAPDAGPAVIHLRSCPFLGLALENPEVVCGVHQGVIGGVLGALGAPNATTELEPFAVPGACVVRIHPRPARRAPNLGPRPGPRRPRPADR